MLTGLSYGSCVQQGSCTATRDHGIIAYDIVKLVEMEQKPWISGLATARPYMNGETEQLFCAYCC